MSLRGLDSGLVVLACTVVGGITPEPWFSQINVSARDQAVANNTDSCPSPSGICLALDRLILPVHLIAPWLWGLATFGVLCMPTVLLCSRTRENGLRVITGRLVQYLSLLICASFLSDHPSLNFAFALHANIRFVVQLDGKGGLMGGSLWWSTRFASVVFLLACQSFFGPPISVVPWDPKTQPASSLSCAYLCHLWGCVVPDIVLSLVRGLVWFGSYVHIRDDVFS